MHPQSRQRLLAHARCSPENRVCSRPLEFEPFQPKETPKHNLYLLLFAVVVLIVAYLLWRL